MQLILLTSVALLSLGMGSKLSAQAASGQPSAALAQNLQNVYQYWRNAMVGKNYNAWKQSTAEHRKLAIQNRILSEKGRFPTDIFKTPTPPPSINGLKLLRANSQGVTAKLIYFGKVDFGIGGQPTDNILVLNFVYQNRGWKYDNAEFVNLSVLKDVRKQIQSGNLSYLDDAAFKPNGKIPQNPIVVRAAKYITKVYAFCPGREVKVSINSLSKHRFQDTQQAEVVIGGGRDGVNSIWYSIKDLPGYKGDDPLTLRVYVFSQINGVKPVKVFQYQVEKGKKPKATGSERFTIDAATAAKVLGRR
ncbi:hypothetical protein JO972_13195 [Verrucomicrobiaceae bacterium 5K15]|uniref:Uncharacterized protein n=2 Tax=Oceaniferula flava TaxID=2800421 RepID=A0AAE2SGE6_9BACT|nr:hypothetical protein [Oceaniferula flavus]MBM1137228.1 hypothetical protein [Oceaniferula flavus]